MVPDLINTIFWQQILKARSLIGHDEEIRSALFLQISMVNHGTGLFAYSYNGYSTDCPGPVVTVSFVVSQLVRLFSALFRPECTIVVYICMVIRNIDWNNQVWWPCNQYFCWTCPCSKSCAKLEDTAVKLMMVFCFEFGSVLHQCCNQLPVMFLE